MKTGIIIAVLFVFIVSGCSDSGNQSSQSIKLTPHTYKVTRMKVQSYLEATGAVQADLEGGAKIVPHVPGVVDRIFVKFGEQVQAGTPLISIRSAEVNDVYTGYQTSLSQLKQAERLYHLNQKLFEIGAVTKNDLLAAEANYEQAKAASAGLKNKLDIYGAFSGKGFQDKLVIKAPIAGYVAELQARIGDRFDTNTAMMTIANPNKIIIVANVYDTDIPKLRRHQLVTFRTDVYPDITFKGRITYISDVSDADAKTVKTYIRIENHQHILKQNMFLKIQIFDEEKHLAVIPKTALIYKNGIFYVNVQHKEQVLLKEIKPIRDTSDKFTAVDGLGEEETIVYSAIDLEKP